MIDANLDVNNNFTIAAASILNLNSYDLDLTGSAFYNNGTLRLQGDETLTNFTNDTDSGLVEYYDQGPWGSVFWSKCWVCVL